MNRLRRRTGYYVALLVGSLLGFAVLYHVGMFYFEGERNTFLHSLQVVVETFTATGYGSDSPWSTPQMNLLVMVMDIAGTFLFFLGLPVLLFPFLRDAFSTTVPTATDGVGDHVVICSFTQRSRRLIDELEGLEVPYVVVESDRDAAEDLVEDGVRVVHGDPERAETLLNAGLGEARALVADVDDETNASVALAANEALEDGGVQIITFVEDPDMADYHRYAGADHVFTPRTLIGESLAGKVNTAARTEVTDAVEIGTDFEVAELPVQPGSELDGVTVAESGIRERTGVNVIGAWFRGEFVSPPDPGDVIDGRTVLLVAGSDEDLERLNALTRSERRRLREGQVLVCGYGEVGSTVKEAVTAAGLPCTAVDVADKPGVDVVGDATERTVLERAGVHESSTVVLALSDDTLTVFATLVIRQLDVDVEIVARANETENVAKLYRAGADYVLALSTVSGRMLAATILEGEVISVGQQIEVVRTDVGLLAGETLASADIRARTGCTVVAVERDGETMTGLDPDFRFRVGDAAVVIGPDDGIAAFASVVDGDGSGDGS
ncbi:potassium channel family protein [Salinirussus salinus]|uniref:potassium channel family protein n=1 Tax=Salinirussus salinus TaxID=1198300 RepID=UPI001357753A|nr:NAD-binding protein [Salinirussus salinus]